MKSHSWKERYITSLKEEFTVKDISKICNCSVAKAMIIRKNAIELIKDNCPDYTPPNVRIDAEAVFAVTGHNSDYYLKKMKAEKLAAD